MPHIQMPMRPLSINANNGNGGNNKMTSLEEKNKCRKSLSKRLITRIKHLQNEREAEVFIDERLRLSHDEELTTDEVVRKIHQLFAERNGFKVRREISHVFITHFFKKKLFPLSFSPS